ncbi:MAG: MFS transporter [Faecalibacterium sp.]|nr:MFS transporter [Ruminococcus sp.]MCM1391312.1 MFS transporter [Ruminococcus sp.]MCM1484866.1 MFS transporter [Faecalibacterium sp.]
MSIRTNFKHTIFASYTGYFVQAIINNFAPLLFLTFQHSFSFSYRQISLLIIINFAVQLIIDLCSAGFIDKIGYRKCIVAAHFLAAAGLVCLGNLPFILPNAYFAVIISIIIYATGSGLIEVIISPLVEACPTDNKSASMSLLHSFYCWGQMSVVALSTLFFTFIGIEHWRTLSALWAIIPFINAFYLLAVPFPKILDEFKGAGIKELFKTKIFLVCAVIMFCAGACELAMSQWASAFAESALNVSKTTGDLLGPCMFAALMGIARVMYAKLSEKVSLKTFMLISASLCIISYLLSSLSPSPLIALIGCGVCGFSVGVMWPGTFSLATKQIPQGGTAMFALLALFGDLGCATGPAAVGYITSIFGDDLSKGLIFAVVFPIILVLMMSRINNNKKV